jgi:hypothetical protein
MPRKLCDREFAAGDGTLIEVIEEVEGDGRR